MDDSDSISSVSHRREPVPERHLGHKQRRSQETFLRLLEAAEAVTSERSFDDVSVAEICERAGLSVGAFYRRFESKDGLLQVLHEHYTDRMLRLQAAALDPARWVGVPMVEMVERVIDDVFQTTRRNIGLLRASARRAQFDPEFGKRESRVQEEFLALVTRLLLQRVDEIGHPQPRIAAEFSAYQLSSVLRYHLVTSPMLGTVAGVLPNEQVAAELQRAVLSYLQVPSAVGGIAVRDAAAL